MSASIEPEPLALTRLLELGRARALVHDGLVGVCRGGVWAALPAAALLTLQPLGWGTSAVFVAWAAAALLAGGWCIWRSRDWRRNYARHLDDYLGAGDRIANAAEFVDDAADDPFKRLAIQEAEAFIGGAGASHVRRRWPWDARLIPLAVGVLVLLSIVAHPSRGGTP
jgi:hypothetical protein